MKRNQVGDKPPRRRPFLMPGLILLIGLAISGAIGALVWDRENAAMRSAFEESAESYLVAIQREFDRNAEALATLGALFLASREVERHEFKIFVDNIFSRHDEIIALEWVPRVVGKDRVAVESAARRDGFRTFSVTELDAQGHLVPAKTRPEYFPVFFVEPVTGNEAVAGFDMFSDPLRRSLLTTARDTGEMLASEGLSLVQDKRSAETGFLLAQPVFVQSQPDRSNNEHERPLMGFVLGAFRVNRFIERVLGDLKPLPLDVYVYDESDSTRPPMLYYHFSRLRTKEPHIEPAELLNADHALYMVDSVALPGRHWTLLFLPAPQFFSVVQHWKTAMVLTVGTVITLLLAIFQFQLLARAARIRTLAHRLVGINTKLAEDIAQRKRIEGELLESRDHIRAIMDSAADGILTLDEAGNLLSFNASAERIFGYSAAEATGKNLSTLVFSANDKNGGKRQLAGEMTVLPKQLLACGAYEVAGRDKNGRIFPAELSLSQAICGGKRLLVGLVRDITARKQAEDTLRRRNRTLAMLSQCNQALLRVADERAFIDEFCRNIVEVGGYPKTWIDYMAGDDSRQDALTASIGYCDRTEPQTSRFLCVPGLSEFLVASIAELKRGEPIISRNIAADPRLDGRCEELVVFGFRSMVFLPIGKNGQFMGLLSICSVVENAFDEEEVRLLRELTSDLAFGISFLRTRKAREAAESKLLLHNRAMESALNGIIITDARQPGNPLIYANPAFEKITGFSRAQALGRDFLSLHGEADELSELEGVISAFENECEGNAIICSRHGDGSVCWNELHVAPVRDDSGCTTHFVGILDDITERRKYEKQLQFQATHDALTGMPNRTLIQDRLSQAIVHAERDGRQLAVLFLDLDHFKMINDTLGHSAGDELLKVMAKRFAGCARAADTIARYGGDEFVILMEVEKPEDISVVTHRLLDCVFQPVDIAGRELQTTVSIGVCFYPRDGLDRETLLKNADAAMYRAKELGRNSVHYYTEELNARMLRRFNMEGQLRQALEREQFYLHYQPKVDMQTGNISGLEALLRWEHPELGFVSPAQFIPLAEETGLIIPIGAWVLETACIQNKAWQDRGLLKTSIAVNLSPKQLEEPEIEKTIKTILDRCGLEPRYLELELTEGAVMRDAESVFDTLARLKALGVKLSMDDFGTGYSSLSYLKRFPFDNLKIDQSFIRDTPKDPDDISLVLTIIAMAHNFKLKVIAEGVETEEQVGFLRQHGCDEIQGYFVSRPIPADQAEKLLGNKAVPALVVSACSKNSALP